MRFMTLAPALLAMMAAPVVADEMPHPLISMSGHGEVTAQPDTATITSGVTSQADTAAAALAANTEAMTALIQSLKEAGIAERDIQTSNFSVNPNYVYTDTRDENGYTKPPRIAGYQVQNTVTVRVRDLANLGAVLDRSVTVGANTINGISFSVDDPSGLYDKAREAAYADARRKAELYAGVAGEALGDVRSISEQQNGFQPQPYLMKTMAMDAAAAPVPVQAGELTFAIDVQVSWDLNVK
jgi:uncharacterized protein YggE